MRSEKIIDYKISKLPTKCLRWCDSEACCCLGCVKLTVTKDEWEAWKKRHNYCERCGRYDS